MNIAPSALALGEAALARATLYRFAGHAFRHPSAAWHTEWDEVARGVSAALEALVDEDATRPSTARCAPAALFESFNLLWAASRDFERIRGDHARIVGHSPRAGATPYETEWTGSAGDILQYHLLADLGGFYRAFGLELAGACDERADHLSIELGFLGFLCVKEAVAQEAGRSDDVAFVLEVQKKFLEEHVLRWVDSFCSRIEREDAGGFYAAAAAFLMQFMSAERRRMGLSKQADLRELSDSSLALEDCCVGCDHAQSCAGPAAHSSAST